MELGLPSEVPGVQIPLPPQGIKSLLALDTAFYSAILNIDGKPRIHAVWDFQNFRIFADFLL